MENKRTYYLFIFAAVICMGCMTNNTSKKEIASTAKTVQDTDILLRDTTKLKETHNQEDLPTNDYLEERLKPIRTNFKRINSITDWTAIKTQDIWETTEGGEAKFYYLNQRLEKITTRHYGETFQLLTEYYILNGKLSFVFEKSYHYNRPIYYDSISMKENNDTETFDFEKSEIMEDRSYFENGKLIHQISNQDCGAPFANDYLLEEQKRIQADFKKLLNYEKHSTK